MVYVRVDLRSTHRSRLLDVDDHLIRQLLILSDLLRCALDHDAVDCGFHLFSPLLYMLLGSMEADTHAAFTVSAFAFIVIPRVG